MKNIYKNTAIAVTFLTIGIALGYTYPKLGKEHTIPTTVSQTKPTIEKASYIASDVFNYELSGKSILKAKEELKALAPFTSDIVIYNTHSNEGYISGQNITNVGELLNSNLHAVGLKSSFINCPPPEVYNEAYDLTREIIKSKVTGYENTILLDVHRDALDTPKGDARLIRFVLDKSNLHFEDNNKFAEQLVKDISETNQVKADLIYYDKVSTHLNQDLSSRAVLIEIGNGNSSKEDVKDCINSLSSALKNAKSITSKEKR